MANNPQFIESETTSTLPDKMEAAWTYKYSLISPWFEQILSQIKRDCKAEHLSIDPHFVRTYFAGKPVARISLDEMRAVYLQQILAGHDRLAEFIANRWIFRNMEMYKFFEKNFEEKVPNFESIEEFPAEVIEPILEEAIQQFGVEPVFCFSVLNDMMLSKDTFEKIQKQALQAAALAASSDQKIDPEQKQIEMLKADIAAIKDRYEKKIEELQKRHKKEAEILKQELQKLQKELKEYKAKVKNS